MKRLLYVIILCLLYSCSNNKLTTDKVTNLLNEHYELPKISGEIIRSYNEKGTRYATLTKDNEYAEDVVNSLKSKGLVTTELNKYNNPYVIFTDSTKKTYNYTKGIYRDHDEVDLVITKIDSIIEINQKDDYAEVLISIGVKEKTPFYKLRKRNYNLNPIQKKIKLTKFDNGWKIKSE